MSERFVVVGGWSDDPCPPTADCLAPLLPPLSDGASFDPATGTWQQIAAAPVPVVSRWGHVVVNNQLYLLTEDIGREDSPVVFLRYDPAADAWARLPAPSVVSMLVAAGDRVVAIGTSDSLEEAVDSVFDPQGQGWISLPADPLGPSSFREGVWLGDSLLLTTHDLVADPGVRPELKLMRMAVLDQALEQWTLLPDSEILGGIATAVAGQVVFPWTASEDGGSQNNWGRSYANGGVFDPADSSWSVLPEPPRGAGFEGEGLNGPGFEGSDGLSGRGLTIGDSTFVAGHLFNPATGEWTPVPAPGWGARSGQTAVSNSEVLFVWGGNTADGNVADGYLLRF